MKLEQIEREAIALPEPERAHLVCKLLDTLPAPLMDISDAEVAEREREMEAGTVEPMSQDEFVRRVQQERARWR